MNFFIESFKNLSEGSEKIISLLSNSAAYIYNEFEDVSWAGFYINYDNCLYLGPFQGKVACTKIEIGKGVCGTSVKNRSTIVVNNVDNFEGHIACDSESRSEIVVPIIIKDKIWGVLDLDSKSLNRFEKCKDLFEETVHILENKINELIF